MILAPDPRNEPLRPMNRRWLRIAAAAAGWGLPGLTLSLELCFNGRAEMAWGNFADVAIPQLGRTAMWAGLAPFIPMLRVRVPLRSGHWVGGLPFYIAFSFIGRCGFCPWPRPAIGPYCRPRPGPPARTPPFIRRGIRSSKFDVTFS